MVKRVLIVSRLRTVSTLLATLFLCAGGCSSNPHLQGVPPEEAQANLEAAPDSLRRFDEPVQLTAAYWDGQSLSIRYDAEGQSYYGHSDHTAKENLSIQTDWLPVYYIHGTDAETFAAKSASAAALPILGADHWQQLRIHIAEAITPAEPAKGTLINVRDETFFLYRDEAGVLRNPALLEKPADVPLASVYRIEAMGASLSQYIGSYLDRIGVSNQHVLFETGESGPYARPFAFVDRKTGAVEFGSLEPFTFGSMPNNYAVKGGKVGWHFTRSYFFEAFLPCFEIHALAVVQGRNIHLIEAGIAEASDVDATGRIPYDIRHQPEQTRQETNRPVERFEEIAASEVPADFPTFYRIVVRHAAEGEGLERAKRNSTGFSVHKCEGPGIGAAFAG